MSSLQTQYNQAAEIFREYTQTQPPALQGLKITPKQQAYMEKHDGFLVITPPLGLYDLIEIFDRKQDNKTWVYKELWDKYDFGSALRVDYIVTETMFLNQTYEQQKKSLAKAKKSLKGLNSIDPRTYVMAQAIVRSQGKPLLNAQDWLRLVQLPMKKTVDGDSLVGDVDSGGGQLRLDGSLGYALPCGGVGLSVAVPLNFEILSSFSSEIIEPEAKQAIALEINRARYDTERLGTWIFVGDIDKVNNLDDLYWSYVIEFMSENDPWSASHDKKFAERIKKNMQYASFGSVGEQKALAKANQRAKERLATLQEGNNHE